MKKALIVSTVTGNILAFQMPYLRLLRENGYEVHVATGDERKELTDYDKKYCFSIARNPFKLENIKGIIELKHIVENEKFDLIHCHTPMGGVIARLAARKARKKFATRVIYTAHGFHFYKGAPLINWLVFFPIEWYLAKYTDTLITINQEDFDFAQKHFSKRCEDIQYVPGVGIDIKKFDIQMTEDEKDNLRESIGISKEDFVLTCVARLDKNKNQGFLIKCMENLVKEHNNIHLLLVGPDEINGLYQKIVLKKALTNNIHFLGSRRDIPQLLKITNVLVSASKREGLPVNVMEAMAAGVVVVSLNCRGVKDLMIDKKNGFILDFNDVDGFCNRIIELSNNHQLIKKMSNNSSKIIEEYRIDTLVNKYKNIYFNNID